MNEENYHVSYQVQESEPESCTVNAQAPAAQPKKRRKAGKFVALALSCALIGGCLGAGGALWKVSGNGASAEPTSILVGERGAVHASAVSTVSVDTGKELTLSEVYTANVNSVVGITADITTTNYWGYQTSGAASGSGFVLTDDGYILTNYHVIEDANAVSVTTFDNTSYKARVVGYDAGNDIAVLKIDAKDLQPVVLGDSSTLTVGETVAAIGNPLGELTFSLTHGVVSALDREITLSSGKTMTLIQTDTAINSGNSGGPLFNLYGEVVGITNAKFSSSSSGASIDNIGFAIPINQVKNLVSSIIVNGYVIKPYLGVSVTTVSAEAQTYGIPQGAAVKQINEDSPAEEAGLKENDIITQVDGDEISSSSDLVNKIASYAPGTKVTLSVYRQGEPQELAIHVTLGEQKQEPQQQKPQQESQSQQSQQNQQSGINPFDMFPFGYGYGYSNGGSGSF